MGRKPLYTPEEKKERKRIQEREYYQRHKTRINAQRRQWQQEHHREYLIGVSNYRRRRYREDETFSEDLRTRARDYYHKNRELVLLKNKLGRLNQLPAPDLQQIDEVTRRIKELEDIKKQQKHIAV